jgi:hypothetical protein
MHSYLPPIFCQLVTIGTSTQRYNQFIIHYKFVGAGIREAAPIGATALEVVAFGGAAPSGGGAKEGIKALTESKNKSEN